MTVNHEKTCFEKDAASNLTLCDGSAEECRAPLYVGTEFGGNGRNDSRRRGGVLCSMQALSWKNAPPARMSDASDAHGGARVRLPLAMKTASSTGVYCKSVKLADRPRSGSRTCKGPWGDLQREKARYPFVTPGKRHQQQSSFYAIECRGLKSLSWDNPAGSWCLEKNIKGVYSKYRHIE